MVDYVFKGNSVNASITLTLQDSGFELLTGNASLYNSQNVLVTNYLSEKFSPSSNPNNLTCYNNTLNSTITQSSAGETGTNSYEISFTPQDYNSSSTVQYTPFATINAGIFGTGTVYFCNDQPNTATPGLQSIILSFDSQYENAMQFLPNGTTQNPLTYTTTVNNGVNITNAFTSPGVVNYKDILYLNQSDLLPPLVYNSDPFYQYTVVYTPSYPDLNTNKPTTPTWEFQNLFVPYTFPDGMEPVSSVVSTTDNPIIPDAEFISSVYNIDWDFYTNQTNNTILGNNFTYKSAYAPNYLTVQAFMGMAHAAYLLSSYNSENIVNGTYSTPSQETQYQATVIFLNSCTLGGLAQNAQIFF